MHVGDRTSANNLPVSRVFKAYNAISRKVNSRTRALQQASAPPKHTKRIDEKLKLFDRSSLFLSSSLSPAFSSFSSFLKFRVAANVIRVNSDEDDRIFDTLLRLNKQTSLSLSLSLTHCSFLNFILRVI